VWSALNAARLNVLAHGDGAAQLLGIPVLRLRAMALFVASMATAAAVAVAGAIGFVGLVVPHLLRPFYGYEPAKLIFPSALGAAALVTAADIAVRLISPDEKLPLGVLTALLGAPFFVWLILRMRRDR